MRCGKKFLWVRNWREAKYPEEKIQFRLDDINMAKTSTQWLEADKGCQNLVAATHSNKSVHPPRDREPLTTAAAVKSDRLLQG